MTQNLYEANVIVLTIATILGWIMHFDRFTTITGYITIGLVALGGLAGLIMFFVEWSDER